MIYKIDFGSKIECLHNEMYDAIVELMNEHKTEVIDFVPLMGKIDHPYITLGIYPATQVGVKKLKCKDNFLTFIPEDVDGYEFDDKWYSVQDDALWASFEMLYEAVWQFFNLKN